MLHRSTLAVRRPFVTVGLSMLALHALAITAAAQQPAPPAPVAARLQGVVVDEATRQPVESATVSLVGTNLEALTGRWGAFSFPGAPLGTVSVRVIAAGHPSIVQEVEVRGDRVAFVQVLLPSVAAVLSEILVRGTRHRGPSTEGARTAADLLALEVPQARLTRTVVGQNAARIRLRANSLVQRVDPLILIDGVVISRMEDAMDALEHIAASDVEEIEVLKGPAAAFLYPLAANGVVLVRTKTGSRNR